VNTYNQLLTSGRGFLKELAANNSREWFDINRSRYEDSILNPARDYVTAMGPELSKLSPHIIADPRINRSIFRINRDTRFSKNKTPYKTHLGIFFWEGNAPKLENSGYYLHLEPDELFIGVGLHIFPKWVLEQFREAVSKPKFNRSLLEAIGAVKKNGGEIGGDKYKRFPAGYSQDVLEPGLLLYKGIYGLSRIRDFETLKNVDLMDFSLEKFRSLAPIHSWLVSLVN